MDKESIFNLMVNHIQNVLPDLESHNFSSNDYLVDLGASSVDRWGIIALTIESLALKIPLSAVVDASKIGDLVEILCGWFLSQQRDYR